MIIWYSANFMPVVKKQSHLCVTSIIITSGLFITMNNEHQLCLWQCSQFHKLILWKFWRTFVWSSAVLLCVRIKPGLKCQNYFCSMSRGVSLHCAAVTKMLGVTTCHVSRVRHVSGRTSQHWPASPPATFLPPGAGQVSGVAGAHQHQLASHPLSTHK